MIWATDRRGDRLPNGSWNTICMSRRSGRRRRDDQPWMSWSRKRMAPSLRSRRSSASPSVVLPEPLSPTTPSVWPRVHPQIDAVDRLDVADGAAQQAALDREIDLHLRRPP